MGHLSWNQHIKIITPFSSYLSQLRNGTKGRYGLEGLDILGEEELQRQVRYNQNRAVLLWVKGIRAFASKADFEWPVCINWARRYQNCALELKDLNV